MLLILKNSATTETIPVTESLIKGVSSVVFQVRGNAWTGTIAVQSRIAGSALPFTDYSYQNLVTLLDVAAGTTIAADGKFAVRADGQDIQLVHTRSGGSVDLAIRSFPG